MLTGSNAGHAANAIFPDDKTLVPQKRGLKAIFTRFPTAANNYHRTVSGGLQLVPDTAALAKLAADYRKPPINRAPCFKGSDVIGAGSVCAVAQPGGSAMFQGSSAS
jgi:hypothetical protein